MLVITLVVWLILVFFSVTNGLEKIWVEKMTSLTAPVRILPTEDYYKSYYYNVDSFAESSNYAHKSIGEKRKAKKTDPYNSESDEEIPSTIAKPYLDKNGQLVDLVKEAFGIAEKLPDTQVRDFEMSAANLKIKLVRPSPQGPTESVLSQAAYIGTFDPSNPTYAKTLLNYSPRDKENAIALVTQNESGYVLPSHNKFGQGILLPKGFREAGVVAGDKGFIAYQAPTASSVQEQRAPVFVAGFYDPGILPVGGKFILANPELVSLIRSNHNAEDMVLNQGINIRIPLAQVDKAKTFLEKEFKEKGISPYFKIETYKEFEFTRDLIQQLHSEKNIFTLISMVIIIVACSNIISMLIILVNDKKTEIGILRSMGASSPSIALIFGLAGTIMGFIGSLAGILLAYVTLQNFNHLVNILSKLQGFQAFNPLFFGNELPHEISVEALLFVLAATLIISMLSGLVPALKASRLKPSQILRSE
jgi:ABC-type lipoprotein release transport system permease subunit